MWGLNLETEERGRSEKTQISSQVGRKPFQWDPGEGGRKFPTKGNGKRFHSGS